MSEFNEGTPEGQDSSQTENQRRPTIPTEISALAQYRQSREQQESSAAANQGAEGGDTSPSPSEDSTQREQYIPRDRFDQVNTRLHEAEQELANARAAQLSQQFQQPQQQQQQFPMQQQDQFVGRTGMVQGQPQQQQPQRQTPDWNDPSTQREWRKKIADNPVTGLREFVQTMFEDQGRPYVQQVIQEAAQQVMGQLQPLQRAVLGQQVQNYAQQKSNDPTFPTVQPYFQNLVQMASQRGIDVTNPQVLGTIEHIARQQAQQQGLQAQPPQQAPQQQQAAPFTERPGNSGANFGRSQTPSLTPQQQAMARTFRMTDSEYSAQLRAMGVQ